MVVCWMAVLCLVYMILALRTNVVFFGIFFTLVVAFSCLAGAYWHLALAYGGQAASATTASKLVVAGGAWCFLTCLLGWYIFFAIMLAALDFPFNLPGKNVVPRIGRRGLWLTLFHSRRSINGDQGSQREGQGQGQGGSLHGLSRWPCLVWKDMISCRLSEAGYECLSHNEMTQPRYSWHDRWLP